MAHYSLKQLEHRPYQVPSIAYNGIQSWRYLLFAHYQVPTEILRPLVHPELTLQSESGKTWIGVVPFYLVIRPRYTPLIPGFSFFPEINVRTYVEHKGESGVWFFSLDATNQIAVWAARKFFCLPYYHARMSMRREDGRVAFKSQRRSGTEILPSFEGEYEPISDPKHPEPGSLEHFLAERYCLYTQHHDGQLCRLDVHHVPWPLQQAKANIKTNSMLAPLGLNIDNQKPLLHYARGIDVITWPLKRIGSVERDVAS